MDHVLLSLLIQYYNSNQLNHLIEVMNLMLVVKLSQELCGHFYRQVASFYLTF